MKKWLVILLFNFPVISQTIPQREQITMDEMAINVGKDSSREVSYTNKQAGVFYTETNGAHRSGWQGWRVMSTEILEDYSISVDGKLLDKKASTATVYPHQLIRKYENGTRETFTLLDSLDAIVVELTNISGKEISIRPFFADSPNPDDYVVSFEEGVLLVAHKRHMERTADANYPVWIGLKIDSKDKLRSSVIAETLANNFSPAKVQSLMANGQLSIYLVAGNTKSQTISLALHVSMNYQTLIAQRKNRMEDLLNYSYVRTNNKRFDKALYWAKISLDALIMNQRGKGIFAGLPWFDNYWGRDSFISLAGATLVTGNFKDAKEILKSFASWQDTNPNSTNYGRIPNLVTTNSIAYNTADGTPRFVEALYKYIQYSGDTAFRREMYPVVLRSIEGTIKYHMDSLCFLTHEDAETWMDAVGPDGAWSPRGNRAVDVQTLWMMQLANGQDLALAFGDNQNERMLNNMIQRINRNFIKYFIDRSTGLFYDHLNADGTPDKQLRPNQLFAYKFFAGDERLLKTVTSNLVYQHGVASLSQDDENFHPYHHYEPHYVQDAAYHNGIVWQWLAGTWIDAVAGYHASDFAYQVTDNMVHQILERGAVGTIAELMDAAPRAGEKEPRLSGAYSQAWSIAEFIRTFYQSYLQVHPNSSEHILGFYPTTLPSIFTTVDARIWMNGSYLDVVYSKGDTSSVISVSNSQTNHLTKLYCDAVIKDKRIVTNTVPLSPGKEVKVLFLKDRIKLKCGKKINEISNPLIEPYDNNNDLLQLALPVIHAALKCLKPSPYHLLSNDEIKQSNPNADILYDINDEEGDDNGSGGYIYPKTVNLKPGSLDITHLTVSSDEKNIYFKLRFKNLSNPGWHPEYGFQLTYVAIAINDGSSEGAVQVGMNSNYIFKDGFKFQKIIYIGGGIRVVNDGGKILAKYVPTSGDEKNPLGNSVSKSIEFSIPNDVIGKPAKSWRYAVLVGAQDDHGGAGIGEFRNVEREAQEWTGGGKNNPANPNVYDVILPKKY